MSHTDDDLAKAKNDGYAEAMAVIAARMDKFRETAALLIEMGNGLIEIADTAQRWLKYMEAQKKEQANGSAPGSTASH